MRIAAVFSIPPGPDLADLLRIIVALLCRGLEKHAVREWTAATFVEIIRANLHRRLARFVAFKARFDAGLAPPLPRPARAPREKVARLFDFVPRERGWLKRTTEHDGAAAFWKLRELLAEPEMAAFIAADPRVGRLLRPLWWMLSPKLGLPEVLRLPLRSAPLSPSLPSSPSVPSSPSETARGRLGGRPPTPEAPRAPRRPREVRLPAFLQGCPGPPILG